MHRRLRAQRRENPGAHERKPRHAEGDAPRQAHDSDGPREGAPGAGGRIVTRSWDAVLWTCIGAFALCVAALASITLGHAAPPPGADPNSEMAQWFRGLMQPGTRVSCCDLSDCRMTEYRAGQSGYEVLIDERVIKGIAARWVPVPVSTILKVSNPTGRA